MADTSRSLNFSRRVAQSVRLRGPLANDPTAGIFHALLLGLLGSVVFYLAFGLQYSPTKPASFGIAAFLGAFVLAAIALLYRGALRSASLLYLGGSWLVFTVMIALNGGVRSAADVFYVTAPISAAWLLGRKAALLTAAACAGAWLILAVLEFRGQPLPTYLPGHPLSIWTVLIAALVIAAVPVAQVLQALRDALAAAHESEQRFRNMADTSPMLIWTSGANRLCDFFNKRWLDFTGRSMEQELGHGWRDGVHADDVERCVATSSSAYDSRTSFQMEYRLRRADGEYRWLLDTGVPRIAPGGAFAGYIGSAIDVTDMKRALDEAFDRQKLESLRLLTGGIAHDFRNLLAGIVANAEIAEEELPVGAAGGDEVRRIKVTAIRAADIVRQLAIFSGQEKGELAPVDLSAIAREMSDLTRTLIAKDKAVQIELGKDLPPVWGNAAQIRQVVMNLVLNASEAIGGQPGSIRVRTSWAAQGDGDFVRLEVADTGRGMDEQERGKAFDPFFSTKANGRGLGLAVVRGIVQSHGGKIEVASAPGRGATFAVLFPYLKESASARAAVAPNS